MGTSPRELAVIDGEFAFTWQDFRQIAQLVHSEAGIVLTDAKVNLVYSRLAKRLRAIGLRSFREYCALVCSQDGVDERQRMIAAMTTNVTRFFRESHHFEYLRKHVLPDLMTTAQQGGRARFWCAGGSSGEEAYSLALTILDFLPEAANLNVRILSTDIDPEMLERGRNGLYQERQMADIPPELRKRWFHPVSSGGGMAFEVAPELHDLIRFRELNLLHEWPMSGRFDVVFCRNVMIYFDETTQNDVWMRISNVLQPGGVLCIGHSERIPTTTHPYDLVGQTIYRRRRAA